jgi:hypothetical protein
MRGRRAPSRFLATLSALGFLAGAPHGVVDSLRAAD